MPSIRKSIEKNNIEVARQRLLEAIYSELPDDRHLGRDAVKQLLNTLIAARERGLAFERIAEILKQSGVDVASVTLRRYFFELKTESELAAEAARHTKKVAETRRAIQDKFLALHTEHGDALARQRLTQVAPRFANAFDDVQTPVPTASPEKRVEADSSDQRFQEPKVARPARFESEGVVSEPVADVKLVSTLPTSENANLATPDVQSEGAMTLADIERASLATEERTPLLGDLELRAGDLVYYLSGQPFQGLLTERQIYLLRRVGRIIVPTDLRSSKDFVSMPSQL
jgi:hypothetical protein